MNTNQSRTVRGSLFVIAGGCSWGFSGVCTQYLFSISDASSLWLTCFRCLFCGAVLVLAALLRHPRETLDIWKVPKDAALLVCYGVFALLLTQYSYLTCISYSNAATATVLQTLNLVFIMLITCVKKHRLPRKIEVLALVLALFGTFMLATGGDPSHMTLSHQGLFWGLALAISFTVYNLLPQKLVDHRDQSVVLGWGMLIAGVTINLLARSWTISVSISPAGWLAVAGVMLFGTLIPFPLFMQGLMDIGPVKASMLESTEPLSATVISALWLGTAFSTPELIGFAAIIAIIFLLAKSE